MKEIGTSIARAKPFCFTITYHKLNITKIYNKSYEKKERKWGQALFIKEKKTRFVRRGYPLLRADGMVRTGNKCIDKQSGI
jgi:hypothetical protein